MSYRNGKFICVPVPLQPNIGYLVFSHPFCVLNTTRVSFWVMDLIRSALESSDFGLSNTLRIVFIDKIAASLCLSETHQCHESTPETWLHGHLIHPEGHSNYLTNLNLGKLIMLDGGHLDMRNEGTVGVDGMIEAPAVSIFNRISGKNIFHNDIRKHLKGSVFLFENLGKRNFSPKQSRATLAK